MELIILLIILIGMNIIQINVSKPSSDHFVHFGFINSIKQNNHQFFTKMKPYINETGMSYPVLLHWILSFFSNKILIKYYKYVGVFFNLLSFLSFYIFINYLYNNIDIYLTYSKFVIVSSLIYIFTPFEYFSWNAKSYGLSARGFGVFLGQLFVYIFFWYILSDSINALLVLYLLSFIILISSQFAFQFVFLFSIISSLFLLNIYIFIIPFVSILILLLILPKWGVFFLVRQYGHKKMYFKYYAYKTILKTRYSIYRDFIYDFFIIFKYKNVKESINYIYKNPIIQVLVGFPVLYALIVYILMSGISSVPKSFLVIIISVFILFVITSFRKTRFLGEPQRYIEFVYPVFTILVFTLRINVYLIIIIFLLSVILILFELLILIKLQRQKHKGLSIVEQNNLLKEFLVKNHLKDEDKIISNNFQILKYFTDSNYKVMNLNTAFPITANLHYTEIFPNTHGVFYTKKLVYFINYYKFNIIIIEKRIISADDIECIENKFNLITIFDNNSYKVYRLCWGD